MGYTTEFVGEITVDPPLSPQEKEFLLKFSTTRRMKCKQGPYYVDRGGEGGQDRDAENVIDYNDPPDGQPSLWCQWVPNEDGTIIEWDGGEKFYKSAEWMKYLIEHFLGDNPLAKTELSFLQFHKLNGQIDAQGEDSDDRWRLIVENNRVLVTDGEIIYLGAKPI